MSESKPTGRLLTELDKMRWRDFMLTPLPTRILTFVWFCIGMGALCGLGIGLLIGMIWL